VCLTSRDAGLGSRTRPLYANWRLTIPRLSTVAVRGGYSCSWSAGWRRGPGSGFGCTRAHVGLTALAWLPEAGRERTVPRRSAICSRFARRRQTASLGPTDDETLADADARGGRGDARAGRRACAGVGRWRAPSPSPVTQISFRPSPHALSPSFLVPLPRRVLFRARVPVNLLLAEPVSLLALIFNRRILLFPPRAGRRDRPGPEKKNRKKKKKKKKNVP